MNKLWKKVFLSITALLLVVVTMASTTFAWMTINSEAWVEGMNFTATGGEGFTISIDGKRFKSQLTKEDISKAVAAKILGYDFSESGDLVDNSGRVLESSEINKVVSSIMLSPLTSITEATVPLSLRNLSNQKADAKDRNFFEFDIYFKKVNISEGASSVSVYFNGEERYSEGTKVPLTSITSKKEYVTLKRSLTCIERPIDEDGSKTDYSSGEKIAIYSSNAMRLGLVQGNTEMIIELTNEYDLGSYATDFDKANSSDENKEVLDRLYNADHNAMYTYYNLLKNDSLEKLSFEKLPKNYYTSLLDDQGVNQILVCELKGNEAIKVTFKLWLEGWDADCFDGIGEQISVQLSFVQKEN